VLWRSAAQSVVAQSSTEAEYYAINEVVRDAAWLRKLLEGMGVMPKGPLALLNDNNGALAWAGEGETLNRRKRHLRIRFDYVKMELEEGRVSLAYVPTHECAADVLTKGLGPGKHQAACRLLGLSCSAWK